MELPKSLGWSNYETNSTGIDTDHEEPAALQNSV